MDDQRNQGRDGPPQQGGQNGRQQQGPQAIRQQQGGWRAEPGRITPESRERRAEEWLQHLDRSPPEPPVEEPIPDPPPAPHPGPLPRRLPRTVSVPVPGPLPGPFIGYGIGYRSANPGRGMGPRPSPYANGAAGTAHPLNFPPTNLPRSIPPPNYMNAAVRPSPFLPDPRTFGPFYPPGPSQWASQGARAPNLWQLGQRGSQPMPPMPMGNHGNWQGAGAARDQRQVVRAPVNPQPRNSATSNAAYNRAANIQQPAVNQPYGNQPAVDQSSGNQPSRKQPAGRDPAGNRPVLERFTGEEPSRERPSRKRPAEEEPAGEQPAPKRNAGGGRGASADGQKPAGEGTAGDQPADNNTGAAVPTNPATMSISERLDRGLITDVAGLTRAEEDEILLWARSRVPKIPWETIRTRYKFKVTQNTLRGRHRKLKAGDKPLPRKPVFTERDNELLLDAIEHLAGGHLDDVDNVKIRKLWTRAKEYVKKHGGQTTAGPSTIKKKYKSLVETIPGIRRDLKPGRANWDHKKYRKFKVQGQEEASFDDNVKGDEPNETPTTRSGLPMRKKPETTRWSHQMDKKYEVEHEEGADFGETDEEENEEEESEDYEDCDEYEDYADEEDENSDG